MDSQPQVYIGTGEKNGFYTLHVIRYSDRSVHDNYIKNLSTDWGKALSKAQDFAVKSNAEINAVPFELDGFSTLRGGALWDMINKIVDPQDIPFGKYKGNDISQLLHDDTQYAWWMVNNMTDTEMRNIPFRVALAIALVDCGIEDPAVVRQREYDERKAEEARVKENADPIPVTDKRIKITGTVLGFKEVEGWGYGETVTKMIFIDDRGFKLYGTAPSYKKMEKNRYGTMEEMTCHLDKGDKVEFMARVEPSKDDTKFGFFKRPTKVQVL